MYDLYVEEDDGWVLQSTYASFDEIIADYGDEFVRGIGKDTGVWAVYEDERGGGRIAGIVYLRR